MKPSGPGCSLKRDFTTNSGMLLIICLSRFSVSELCNFGRLCVSRNLSISLNFSMNWYTVVHSSLLWCFICSWCQLLCLHFHLWLYFFFFLVYLKICWFFFSIQKPALCFIDLLGLFFKSFICFYSDIYYFFLSNLGIVFFSSFLRCIIRLFEIFLLFWSRYLLLLS